jgi:ketosteroid isomerase-like protein
MTADTPQACAANFTAALIGRDMDAALTLLTDEVVFFYSNGTAILGKDAFATLMTTSWKMIENYKYQSGESNWIAQSADAATLIYSFSWTGEVRGSEVSGGGRGTRVFVKQAQGGWLLAHEHLSNGQWKP